MSTYDHFSEFTSRDRLATFRRFVAAAKDGIIFSTFATLGAGQKDPQEYLEAQTRREAARRAADNLLR